MLAKISKKGQITLPAEIRKRLGITAGEYVRFVIEDKAIRLEPSAGGISSLRGCLKVGGPQDFKVIRQSVMEARAHEKARRH